jgi:hypothetical protein
MRTCDVVDFKTRSEAVYGTIALDLLGKRLDSGQVRPTDVVSVIEMNDEASLLLEREPMTNVLYNKLVDRRLQARPHEVPSSFARPHSSRTYTST